jgi:hypothetical protein
VSADERTFDSRQEAILAALSEAAREGGGAFVLAHQEGCAMVGFDDDTCDCEPERLEVGITS